MRKVRFDPFLRLLPRFIGTLNKAGQEFYVEATEPERAAFRIGRDLAQRKGGEFFLSCPELAVRLGTTKAPLSGGHSTTAARALIVLKAEGFIEKIKCGERLSPSTSWKQLSATVWRWNDSPLPPSGGLADIDAQAKKLATAKDSIEPGVENCPAAQAVPGTQKPPVESCEETNKMAN